MYKIYKIVDNTNGNIYIGITTLTLQKRLSDHKRRGRCSSRDIIKNGDYRIQLIEETDDKTRERYWIENTECVNERIPGRTTNQYYSDNKDKKHNYYVFKCSWGGDPRKYNNLLKIDPYLFN